MAFVSWRDRALLFAILVIAAAGFGHVVRSLTEQQVLLMLTLSGSAIGAFVQGAAVKRLHFHATETALAGAALNASEARPYLLTAHSAVLGTLTILVFTFRPPATLGLLAGYVVGASAAAMIVQTFNRLRTPFRVPSRLSQGRSRGRRVNSPFLAAAAALATGAVLLGLRTHFPPVVQLSFLAAAVMAASLMFERVDHAVVRFESVAGRGPGHSIWSRSKPLIAFLATLAAAATVLTWTAVAVVATLGMAMLVWNAAKICLYRLHPKRSADLLLAGYAVVLALAAASVPLLVPVLVSALAVFLWRRSADAAWLIA